MNLFYCKSLLIRDELEEKNSKNKSKTKKIENKNHSKKSKKKKITETEKTITNK